MIGNYLEVLNFNFNRLSLKLRATSHTSHDHEMVRAQKKSVQRPSQDTFKIM